ncbi:hypothetical protein [Neobacillus sp. LXY-4]|uniref:hypothetical protein n=1 Tax=Neobacillus sp. LXY-4 TaxID=3379826 RepID=UPI003EDEC7A2
MFDPTAFENLKVVIEGAVYDKDLSGEILVIDRNDTINLAKLERKFDISFVDRNNRGKKITAIWVLEAGLENLAAELLPAALSEKRAGCHVTVKFVCGHPNEISYFKNIESVLYSIWGVGRTIEQCVHANPLSKQSDIKNEITIKFNRLIYESHMEDLTEMVDFMITSIKELNKIFQ